MSYTLVGPEDDGSVIVDEEVAAQVGVRTRISEHVIVKQQQRFLVEFLKAPRGAFGQPRRADGT